MTDKRRRNVAKERLLDLGYAMSVISYNQHTGNFVRIYKCRRKGLKERLAGSICTNGYRQIRLGANLFQAHRLAWFLHYAEWPTDEIDHINGNRDDNRICNLRSASRQQNMCNKAAYLSNTSGHKGVSFKKELGKWFARCQSGGIRKHLGYFETKEEAFEAYCAEATKSHKEYANNGASGFYWRDAGLAYECGKSL